MDSNFKKIDKSLNIVGILVYHQVYPYAKTYAGAERLRETFCADCRC